MTTDDELHTPECFANHMGLWACLPMFLRQTLAAIRAGHYQAATPRPMPGAPYAIDHTGVATIHLAGALMKGRSKYGGTSTVDARRAVRAAAADKEVRGIMLHVDSPGGHVAGTEELTRDIENAAKRKPVHAHIDDLGASAALWAASPAARITANESAEVGSIGVFAVLYDESEALEAAGVKVHVVSTGEHKGAGAPGAPVTDAQLQHFQAQVDGINQLFRRAMEAGRKNDRFDIDAVADGRTFLARDAQKLGIIDAVSSMDTALRDLRASINRREAGRDLAALAAESKSVL